MSEGGWRQVDLLHASPAAPMPQGREAVNLLSDLLLPLSLAFHSNGHTQSGLAFIFFSPRRGGILLSLGAGEPGQRLLSLMVLSSCLGKFKDLSMVLVLL